MESQKLASKQSEKGSRFEYLCRDMLTAKTGVKWDRVPQSGAGVIKGDLFCLTNHYYHAFECKSFADSVIMENLLTAKSNNIYSWREQARREALQMGRLPAILFKKDRGKPMIGIAEQIEEVDHFRLYTTITGELVDIHIYLFEDWLAHKQVKDLILK